MITNETTDTAEQGRPSLIPSGVKGLDDILRGGLASNRLYLVEGNPGSGKTTFALQFLRAGAMRREPCLFVSLSESEEELRDSAESHGWTLEGIQIFEMIASENSLKPDARYTMYHPSEVELAEMTKAVLAEADRIKPARLVFDSLSEFRLLAETPLRYRRQILALKQHFSRQQCTVLFTNDLPGNEREMHLDSLAHGVITLDSRPSEYGKMRRRLLVSKVRGQSFGEGYHDLVIRRGGVEVFPRLEAAEQRTNNSREDVKSGLESLDALLGGGPARGTSTLILGGAGTGKSTLATQYACAAAERGEHVTIFTFDAAESLMDRAAGLGMDMESHISAGRLFVQHVEPAEMSPGEFAHRVRTAVETDKTRVLVVDSLNGYLNAMTSQQFLTLHLHELLTYLGQQGVTTLLLMTQQGFIADPPQTPLDASYLADNIIFLRYFEAFGEIRQAISVIKKRTGAHERTIRELRFDKGIDIGEPVRNFQGVLTGVPRFLDRTSDRPTSND